MAKRTKKKTSEPKETVLEKATPAPAAAEAEQVAAPPKEKSFKEFVEEIRARAAAVEGDKQKVQNTERKIVILTEWTKANFELMAEYLLRSEKE